MQLHQLVIVVTQHPLADLSGVVADTIDTPSEPEASHATENPQLTSSKEAQALLQVLTCAG